MEVAAGLTSTVTSFFVNGIGLVIFIVVEKTVLPTILGRTLFNVSETCMALWPPQGHQGVQGYIPRGRLGEPHFG